MLTKIAKSATLILALVLLAGGLHTRANSNGGGTVFLPLVSRTGALPLPPPDEASQRIQVPPGFHIRVFAAGLASRPRFMALAPDGHLYLTLTDSGQIVRLPDRDNNGLSDGVEIIASGLSLPHGLAFHQGWLYVAEGSRVQRLAGPDASGNFSPPQLVSDNIPAPAGHSSRTVIFGADGKMYVSAGSSCNLCVEDDPRRAAILRFNPDGSIPADNPFTNDSDPRRRPLWAWGLRNSVGMVISPQGGLWVNHNGSDGMGDDLPPEEIVIDVQPHRSHGWPFCYTPGLGVSSAPETRDTRIALPSGFTCSQAVAAIFTAPAHSAPLGMTLGSGVNFPPDYAGDLYVAYHGSWNTNDPANFRDCKVERVLLQNGQPVGSQVFANGWRAPGKKCGDAATWGRPADVIFGRNGELFISDDKGMRVYRVIYQP
ncbi:MAG: PQQ-dependent sugar dehydrogenase [Chloroflexota bacterium]